MKWFMEFLFSPAGVGSLILTSITAYLSSGKWWPLVRSWFAKAIPGDTDLEKLVLGQADAVIAALLASGQLETLIAALVAMLKARGMSESEAQQVVLGEIPLVKLKLEYESAKARTAAKFGRVAA